MLPKWIIICASFPFRWRSRLWDETIHFFATFDNNANICCRSIPNSELYRHVALILFLFVSNLLRFNNSTLILNYIYMYVAFFAQQIDLWGHQHVVWTQETLCIGFTPISKQHSLQLISNGVRSRLSFLFSC